MFDYVSTLVAHADHWQIYLGEKVPQISNVRCDLFLSMILSYLHHTAHSRTNHSTARFWLIPILIRKLHRRRSPSIPPPCSIHRQRPQQLCMLQVTINQTTYRFLAIYQQTSNFDDTVPTTVRQQHLRWARCSLATHWPRWQRKGEVHT